MLGQTVVTGQVAYPRGHCSLRFVYHNDQGKYLMTQEIFKHLTTQYLRGSEDLLCQDGFKVAVLTGLERVMSHAAPPSSEKEN